MAMKGAFKRNKDKGTESRKEKKKEKEDSKKKDKVSSKKKDTQDGNLNYQDSWKSFFK